MSEREKEKEQATVQLRLDILSRRVDDMQDTVRSLCDAIQWIVNRGPEKVPGELMEKMVKGGT